MLNIADQLRLQELKLYFKYIHKKLPAYLLDWEFISNVNKHFHDTRTSSKFPTVRTKQEFANKMSDIQLTTYYKRYSCNSGRKYTHTAYEVSQHNMQNISAYKNIQIHVQYKIVNRVINIIIRNVYLMDGNHIFWYTRLSSFFSSYLHSSISTHPPSPSHF